MDGLLADERRCTRLPKDRGRDLPAGITVDAGGIDEEIAWYILGDALLEVGHVGTSKICSFYPGFEAARQGKKKREDPLLGSPFYDKSSQAGPGARRRLQAEESS